MASIFTDFGNIFDTNIELKKETPKPKPQKDRFKIELQKIFQREGGYVNDPTDSGGETIYGISRRAHPDAWERGIPSKQDAAKIYRQHYWDALKADYLPPKTASVLMDHAVLSGVGAAERDLRSVLKLGGGGVDSTVIQSLNSDNDEEIARQLTIRRINLFEDIANRKPEKSKFLNSWIRRAKKAYEEAGGEGDILKENMLVSPRFGLTRGINPDKLRKDSFSEKAKRVGLLNYGIKQSVLSAGRRLLEEKRHADEIKDERQP